MATIGIDIGGTNIEAGVVDYDLGKALCAPTCTPTKSSGTKEQVLEQIAEIVDVLFSRKIKAIGIGSPGIVDPDSGIVYETANIPSWKNVEVTAYLKEKFGVPAYLNNDANCFVLGEKHFGKGKEIGSLVGITLGTGLGAGIIINGMLHSGYNCAAGEICGLPFLGNTYEDYCSKKFFGDIDVKELHTYAKEQSRSALGIFHEFGYNVGKAVAALVCIIDPQMVVFGGSICNAYDKFKPGLDESLKRSVSERIYKRLKVEVSELENSGILGAAALCYR